MKETNFKKYLESKGITLSDLVDAGIPRGTAISHFYGTRGISFLSAKKYQNRLGLPLQELAQFVSEGETEHIPLCIQSHAGEAQNA